MMMVVLTSIALVGVRFLVYFIEPLSVLGVFERPAPNVTFEFLPIVLLLRFRSMMGRTRYTRDSRAVRCQGNLLPYR
jgi:hypothetical protein